MGKQRLIVCLFDFTYYQKQFAVPDGNFIGLLATLLIPAAVRNSVELHWEVRFPIRPLVLYSFHPLIQKEGKACSFYARGTEYTNFSHTIFET